MVFHCQVEVHFKYFKVHSDLSLFYSIICSSHDILIKNDTVTDFENSTYTIHFLNQVKKIDCVSSILLSPTDTKNTQSICLQISSQVDHKIDNIIRIQSEFDVDKTSK